MGRLIDDIRASGKLAMPWCVAPPKMLRWKIYSEQLWRILRSDMPVIKIDNVADYNFTDTDQEHWKPDENLALLFELVGFEHHIPKVQPDLDMRLCHRLPDPQAKCVLACSALAHIACGLV